MRSASTVAPVTPHGWRGERPAHADRGADGPDVTGAAAYHDARVDLPERLALENVLDAEAHQRASR